MAGYIGHKPKVTNYTVDEFTTTAPQASSGNFTLSQTVDDSKTLEVSVGGIDQPQSAYTVTGTTLAFGASIVAQNDIVIARHAGESISYPSLEDGAVTDAKIGTGAVTAGKLASSGTMPAWNGAALTGITHTPANNSVGLDQLAGGTDGNLITFDTAGDPAYVATGTAGHILTSAGANAVPTFAAAAAAGFTLGTEQATTSGTGVTFGSIPSGTKMIIAMFEEISFTTQTYIAVQIGDAGGIETGGYIGYYGLMRDGNNYPNVGGVFTAFGLLLNYTGGTCTGQLRLTLKDAANFTWVGQAQGTMGSPSSVQLGGGVKSLSAELTQIKVMPGYGNFDAGSVNIMYQ